MDTPSYRPHGKTAAILRRALELVESVPYAVSVRWLFYRLLQEGYYSTKADYARFLDITSKARHAFWEGWHPDTLADETREAIVRGGGFANSLDWFETVRLRGVACNLDKWRAQPCYVELWFEARAMAQQFEHCGLTAEQAREYGVPENPEKPGEFQWEALSDEAAREIITAAVSPFTSLARFSETVEQEQRAHAWLREALAGLELPAELA